MADEVFKLPQSSYETICKVVMSYTHIGTKTSLGEVSKILGSDTTVVSRNIAFLVAVGVLEGGRDKGITALGSRLGRALEFGQDEEISRAWREILSEVPLIQRIISAIRVRGGMDAGTLQTQIVYTAGVSKTSGTMTGGAAIIEMLKSANLITERDGKFISSALTESVDSVDAVGSQEVSGGKKQTTIHYVNNVRSEPDVAVRVEVQIRLDATPEDLNVIGTQLRSMIAELRRVDPDIPVEIEAPPIEP